MINEGQPKSQINLKTAVALFLVMGSPVFAAMVCNHMTGVDRLVNPLSIFGVDTRSAEEKYEDQLLEDFRNKQQTPTPTPTPEAQSSVIKKAPFEHGNTRVQNSVVRTQLKASSRG